jgi:ubiquinone/menaquinone biosynthesis C-methylase UbiE
MEHADIYNYDEWQSGEPYEWGENARSSKGDAIDFHVDLGCGTAKKARIGIDQYPAPGVNILMDLDSLAVHSVAYEPNQDAPDDNPEGHLYRRAVGRGLPFRDESIRSIISHHALEHVGDGFPKLMDECWRVLEPGAPFRIIVPLFPSHSALVDPDHKRFFVEGTFEHLLAYREMGFAVPYMQSEWELADKDITPPPHWTQMFTIEDSREMRVTLRKPEPEPEPEPES